jgi:hypothetical protein
VRSKVFASHPWRTSLLTLASVIPQIAATNGALQFRHPFEIGRVGVVACTRPRTVLEFFIARQLQGPRQNAPCPISVVEVLRGLLEISKKNPNDF